jgi:hypothetical protein
LLDFRLSNVVTFGEWDQDPISQTRKFDSLRGQSLVHIVDELISPIAGAWDGELMRSLFLPGDAVRI